MGSSTATAPAPTPTPTPPTLVYPVNVARRVRAIAINVARRTGGDVDDLMQIGALAVLTHQLERPGIAASRHRIQGAMVDYQRILNCTRRKDPVVFVGLDAALFVPQITHQTGFDRAQTTDLVALVKRTRMKETWKRALLLTTLGDMNTVECGRVMGLFPSTIERMARGAVRKIRKNL